MFVQVRNNLKHDIFYSFDECSGKCCDATLHSFKRCANVGDVCGMCEISLETTIVTARAMAPSSDSGRFSGIRKSKSTMHPSSGQRYYTGDVWLRHLECIPGLSKKKARNVATRFPTLSSLLSHYSSLSTDQERHSALEDIISAGQKKERVISKRVYKVFTSSNADEPLWNIKWSVVVCFCVCVCVCVFMSHHNL